MLPRMKLIYFVVAILESLGQPYRKKKKNLTTFPSSFHREKLKLNKLINLMRLK